MAGFTVAVAIAIFGVGAAMFFAHIAATIKSLNSGIFRFFFISFGLIMLICGSASMAFIARATEASTEDISGIALTFDYATYGLTAVLALWVMYFILGIMVQGAQFAMSFLDDSGLRLKKERNSDEYIPKLPALPKF
jgi:hypothetical protein